MKEQNEKKIDSIFRSTVRFEIRRKKKKTGNLTFELKFLLGLEHEKGDVR